MAKFKYDIAEWLKQDDYLLYGKVGDVFYEGKPWKDLTQKELRHYAENTHPDTIKKHLVTVKLKKNDTAQDEATTEATTETTSSKENTPEPPE